VVVIPGWHNKLAAALLRRLPEPWSRAYHRRGSAAKDIIWTEG
jgi:hypothetical protein